MKLDGASVHRAGKAAVVTQDNPWRPASSAVTTHPNPAEARRRWRGERSKPVRLGVRAHHTRSLGAESPAQTAQWCCWLCRRRIIFEPTCARGRGMLAAGPELRITGAAAQTRMVSVARIRLVSRKSPRLFKGIICDDISEFESHMPSQAVRSLSASGMKGSQSSGLLSRLRVAFSDSGKGRTDSAGIY